MPSYKEALEITSELLQRRASGPKDREIKATDRIQEDLGLDSLAVMELASDVESRFGVSIPSEMYDSDPDGRRPGARGHDARGIGGPVVGP